MNRKDFQQSKEEEENQKGFKQQNKPNLEDSLQSNQNIIRGSQRSDGTFRKDIKIRDGFINMFDAELYKIPQRRGDATENIRGHPNEQKSWRNDVYQSFNYKQKGKDSTTQSWRSETKRNIQGGQYDSTKMQQQEKAYKNIDSSAGQEDFPNLIVNQITSNKLTSETQRTKWETLQIGDSSTNQNQKETRNENSYHSNSENYHGNINNIQFSTAIKDKELKKLQKKLREIENLEERQKKGLELQPEAVEKISKKEDIVSMLEKLSIQEESSL